MVNEDVPCSLQELLGLLQLDVLGEELSYGGFLVLQWTECSIGEVSDGMRNAVSSLVHT